MTRQDRETIQKLGQDSLSIYAKLSSKAKLNSSLKHAMLLYRPVDGYVHPWHTLHHRLVSLVSCKLTKDYAVAVNISTTTKLPSSLNFTALTRRDTVSIYFTQ